MDAFEIHHIVTLADTLDPIVPRARRRQRQADFDMVERQLEELFARIAEHPARGLVHVEKPPRVGLHHQDRLSGLIQELSEPLTLEIAAFLRRDLVEDRHHVLFVVLQVFQGPGGVHGVPDGVLEAVSVELGFVPIEFLREGDNRLLVQRMGGLTLQILENPPKLPQMPEIIVQNQPPYRAPDEQCGAHDPAREDPTLARTPKSVVPPGAPPPPNGNGPPRMYLDHPPGINLRPGGTNR